MDITFTLPSGERRDAREPYAGARHLEAHGACPACGITEGWKVRGGDPTNDHDTFHAVAYCTSCGEPVGKLAVRVSTIFGIDEDRAVLCGRARVY